MNLKSFSICSSLWLAFVSPLGAEPLSYSRQIQPLLADRCFSCHGPDDDGRKAKLRLDSADGAAEVLKSGELAARIESQDPEEMMPPPESHLTLSVAEIALLKRWVEAGAKYEKHWAFTAPEEPSIPAVGDREWPRNGIDFFVLNRLQDAGLKPSPEAERYTLIRRLYLDLIGLPPTPQEADAFVQDKDPQAYEKQVDRLLASPHYGERWARQWLDLARYADTNGYEKDRPRSIWPYRDWVIKALNSDMPFDRFSIEQLAGDMLPGATAEQRIATGFHRNTMLNEEGGIDPLEYRHYAMVDRVATTGTVWLGLTIGCAQCHTHKYDPITHSDYYRFMALMNNVDEPTIAVPDAAIAARRQALNKEIDAAIDAAIVTLDENAFESWIARERERSVPWQPLVPTSASATLPRLEILDDDSIFASGDFPKRDVYTLGFTLQEDARISAIRLAVLPDERLPAHGPGAAYYEGRSGDFFLSELSATIDGRTVAFSDADVSYGKVAVGKGPATGPNVLDGKGSTGWSTANREGERHHLVLNLSQPIQGSQLEIELLFERHFVAGLGRFRFDFTTARKAAVVRPGDAPDPHRASIEQLKRYYVRSAKPFAKLQTQIANLGKKMPKFPTSMVLSERPPENPRQTFRHHRGEYLSVRETVSPGVPGIFPQLRAEQPNRLDLARWLVSTENPLGARVAVNRAWQAFFGQGLVKSPDDFGTQSEPPSHPQLLDWLALRFVEMGWSQKQLNRLLVTSATYRQRSAITPEALRLDPQNLLLGRGARFRVDGELVRDSMLTAAGLLSDKLGGRSVYPPQPASVTALAYGRTKWTPSKGPDRYRRSLYTVSKRTAPFAAYLVFDGPTGEACMARRQRSNTPLQSLTLLNDAMFIEMAEALAERALGEADDAARAEFLFRRCLIRPPRATELNELLAFYREQHRRFESDELKESAFLKAKKPTPELAAWTLVARALFNLDEAVTKE